MVEVSVAAILLEIGWGGRIRTFTVLINSEVSYQLDHAPAGARANGVTRASGDNSAEKRVRSIFLEYHGGCVRQTPRRLDCEILEPQAVQSGKCGNSK